MLVQSTACNNRVFTLCSIVIDLMGPQKERSIGKIGNKAVMGLVFSQRLQGRTATVGHHGLPLLSSTGENFHLFADNR